MCAGPGSKCEESGTGGTEESVPVVWEGRLRDVEMIEADRSWLKLTEAD